MSSMSTCVNVTLMEWESIISVWICVYPDSLKGIKGDVDGGEIKEDWGGGAVVIFGMFSCTVSPFS